jgi:hypothetical protein
LITLQNLRYNNVFSVIASQENLEEVEKRAERLLLLLKNTYNAEEDKGNKEKLDVFCL